MTWIAFLLTFPVAACPHGPSSPTTLDGERLLGHVEKMTSWGPHPAGSAAQKKVGLYLIQQLKEIGLQVRTHAFTAMTPLGPKEMVNIWGVLPGRDTTAILLCSHYDSKFFPNFTFVGANDSGSSSAMILEMARILARDKPLDLTVWFVFFDGEEAFEEWTETDSLYGSREFVRMLRQRSQIDQVAAMILLDLIGGRELGLRKDVNSSDWLNALVWKQAERMGHSDLFWPEGTTAAQDDHIPFRDAGIPVIDLIDLRYQYWHTPEDTADKLSVANMQRVGEVLLASLPKIQTRLRQRR
jgi:Zn-dependent M28 family amino/carboxypeptidase